MKRLEVSGAVRLIYWSLGVKRLSDTGPWSYYECHKWLWYGYPYSVTGIGQDYSLRHLDETVPGSIQLPS